MLKKKLAQKYGVSPKTLKRWFDSAGIKIAGKLLSPADLEIVYERFGEPKT